MNKQTAALVTCEQFKLFLRANFENFDDLVNFSAVRALDDGENYITTIIRIRADIKLKGKLSFPHTSAIQTEIVYITVFLTLFLFTFMVCFRFLDTSLQRVQLILKIPLKVNENKGSENNEEKVPTSADDYHELFVIESDMYDKIVPELEGLYANFDNKIYFKPKQYRFAHELTCNYILLEDLQARGFKNAPRREGLNVEHTNAVLAKLAQWHAASAKRVEIRGDYPEEYLNSYFSQQNLTFIENMNAAFNEPFAQCLESYDLLLPEKEIIVSNSVFYCGNP